VWVIKSRGQLGWLSEQLSSVSTEFQNLQGRLRDIKLEITVYVTCDESFTDEHKSLLSTITAPKHDIATSKVTEHGTVQYRGRPASEAGAKIEEKEEIRELSTATTTTKGLDETQVACGSERTCCCRTEVDENASPDGIAPCCCTSPNTASEPNSTSKSISRVSSAPSSSDKQKLLVHPSIAIYSGRPKTRDIIRRSLEQALGESAVVVCGPQGLVADVKRDVCSLSDERAVHKGTGAQGIFLHTESFSY
jgi:hypothetical protein